MSNQPSNLANKLAAVPSTNNNENENETETEAEAETKTETMNAKPLVGAVSNEAGTNVEEQKANIKSVELKGKDALNLKQIQNNPTLPIAPIAPIVPIGTSNSNNLTKKKKKINNPSRNLTQRQNPNVNAATAESANANSENKNVMSSLNNVAINLLNHQIIMKLFHFQTELYGAHKASDTYLEKFAITWINS